MNWVWEQFNEKGAWLYRIMLLNLMWIGFTLLGGIIFGLFPATVSLFSVMRKWLRGEADISVVSHFIETYKESFVKSNMAGLVILGIGIFLSVDLYISQKYLGNFFVHLVLLFLFFLYGLTVLFFFPTFVHLEMKSLSYLKQSFFMTFIRPLQSLLISVIFMMIMVIVSVFPFLMVFFAGPMLAYPIMWIGNKVFKTLESMEGK
jgi:uncharacterized membrane protein YesL